MRCSRTARRTARSARCRFNRDTDGDGLTDLEETNTGHYVSPSDTGSNPWRLDTDGDGWDDGTEVAQGTDPNTPPWAELPGSSSWLLGLWLALLGAWGLRE